MNKYADCGGCGRMFNLDRPVEVVDMDVHNCQDEMEVH